METIILDAQETARGRIASYAAKQALLGKEVFVVNCEKASISGTDVWNVADFKKLRTMNHMKPTKGPFVSRDPEKIMKRAIRGMLPDYRVGRGRVAWKKIKCYVGIPLELKDKPLMKMNSKPLKKKITIKELSEKA